MLKLYVRTLNTIKAMRDESGQDLIEYALVAALVAVVGAATLPTLGPKIAAVFTDIASKL